MKENIVKEKSFRFAVRIVKLYRFFTIEKNEYVLSKQLLRSGTSIGSNIEEANSGQTKKDFIAKLSIALKEAKETHYWLRLMFECNYFDEKMYKSFLDECEELIMLLTSIIKTSRQNL